MQERTCTERNTCPGSFLFSILMFLDAETDTECFHPLVYSETPGLHWSEATSQELSLSFSHG